MDHPTDADTDLALSRAWEHGDERGYDALVTRYAPVVYARCRRALGAADADDATQAVFLVLARKRAQASASPALAGWLLTVADNVIRNARRDLARRRRAEATSPCPPPTDETDMSDIQDHLDAAMADLPVAERTAVQLHFLAGHTLAEVAAEVGAPVSTVHVRVQRGLERLRCALGKRGATIGALLLMSVLVGEASAAVPPGLLVRLRVPTAAGGGVGATSVVSARALRWSRQGLSPMQKLALTSSTLLLALGATYPFLTAADTAVSTSPQAAPPAAGVDAKRKDWLVAQLVDGARSAERLGTLAEMELLPAAERQQCLARLASTRHAVFAGWAFSDSSDLDFPHLRGWLDATEAQAPVMEWARTWLRDATSAVASQTKAANPLNPVIAEGSSYLVGSHELQSRVTVDGARITWSTGHEPLDVPADLLSGPAIDDVVVAVASTTDDDKMTSQVQMTFRFAKDGIRLHYQGPRKDGGGGDRTVGHPSSLPGVDPGRFDRLPSDAIAAMIMASTPASSLATHRFAWLDVPVTAQESGAVEKEDKPENGEVYIGIDARGAKAHVGAFNPHVKRILATLKQALEHVDGNVTAWVQPGTPIPIVSLTADLSQAAAHDLMNGLGLTPDEQGVAGRGGVLAAWRSGRLIVTTNPLGPDAVVESGGFTAHQEVKNALVAMTGDCWLQAILRPTALMAQAHGYAPLILSAVQQEQFDAYQKRVRAGDAFAFISMGSDAQGSHLDAGGLLAIVAGITISKLMMDPAFLLHAIN